MEMNQIKFYSWKTQSVKTLVGKFNNRYEQRNKRANKLEYTTIEITESHDKKEKKNEEKWLEPKDTLPPRRPVHRVQGSKKKRECDNVLMNIAQNSLYLMKDTTLLMKLK